MLHIGMKGVTHALVTKENTAKMMGSGSLPVLATPAMIALMEAAAAGSVEPHLETGKGTVGTLIQVKHVSATPVNMNVRAESALLEVDGKRLVFSVKAYDAAGLIGEGTHERFIIDNVRFMDKTNSKSEKI